ILEALTPFDLGRGPLMRARLLRLDEQNYVLLITIHHIASDGWSQGVLYRELATLYTAFCRGQRASLPRLPIQYADYAVWQRNWLQGPVLEEQVAYWRERLAGAPSLLELPTDHPRPAVQRFYGAIYSFSLPISLAEQVRALSQREGVTLFMTLLAAFQVLLHRYSGQEDFVVGTPIANRTPIETEGLIGFFVNTLVLRTDLAEDPSFLQLLGRVREVCLGAYAHQELPFEKLVEVLQPERSLSHNPLFQVMFAFQNMALGRMTLPGAIVEPLMVESPIAKFDLSLYLTESQEGELHGAIEYSTDLFEEQTIKRLTGHYQQILEVIVANPEQQISQFPLLSEVEWEQIIWQWNATEVPYPREACLPQLFEEQVARTPEAIAVIYKEQQVTYRDLNARVNQLAHYLRDLEVGPETRVGVCLEPSVELVVGILGILKAGGAYVPLDPSYPVERLSFMLQDAQAPVVLTQAHLLPQLASSTVHFLCLDANWEQIAQQPASSPGTRVEPENLAYVIYTSGSTGRPKGVLATHRATINRLSWMWRTYPFAPGEVCCQKTSLSFVDAVWEIFGPLLQGVPTVLIPNEQLQDPQEFIETLASKGITRIVLVPSLLQTLLNLDDNLQECLPRLTFWATSGEALSLELLRRFQEVIPTGRLLNLYGSSEVAADATCYEAPLQNGVLTDVPVGRPISNTQVYVLDTHLHPVPIGGQGELYIGGAGVARGYLDRPDLTAERFIPHPFSNEPGKRLYKTGDRVRYLPTGELEFLGRTDHQVKIRGFRIELGEVEAMLSQHPLVQKTVVLAREDVPGEKRLVAYVISSQEELPSVQDLRRYLQERLPEYMIPSAFVFLEALPLMPNGKINRQALPPPRLDQATLKGSYMEPCTLIEEALAAIWAEVLHLERVGIHDNFFELGGDSILTIQVAIRALRAGVQLTPKQLFQHQTIAELAEVVEIENQKAAYIQPQQGQPAQLPSKTESLRQLPHSYTPTDFPLAGLDKEEFSKLADLLGKLSNAKESSK
ncbi:MAG: non-ribosomal peptide synthetase, partial [Ktedonobacteraceae bacterium]